MFIGHESLATASHPLNNIAVSLLGLFFLVLAFFRSRAIKLLKNDLQYSVPGEKNALTPLENLSDLSDLPLAIDNFRSRYYKKAQELADENLDFFAINKTLQYKTHSLGAILQEFPDGILLLDESGEVTQANRKITTLLENDIELIGMRVHEFSKNAELTAFLARYQGKNRLRRAENIEFCPQDRPDNTFMVAAYPLLPKDESHTPLGTLVIIRDITSEVLARKARGEFVSHVSHELKSPLNVLKMYSEMLLDQRGDSDEFRLEAVNTIYDEVDRLETLINNLLSISKIEMGSIVLNRQRVKPVDFLKDIFETICRTAKKSNLSFNLDLPHEISPVSIDKDLFRVAINNLLTNAIKYNVDGGSVDMIVRETDEKISIIVKDTGLGISDDDQKKIFEKFFRSEDANVRERTGHGVGLSLAKSIIELHHGRLSLSSVIGEGTTFTLDLEKGEGLVREGI